MSPTAVAVAIVTVVVAAAAVVVLLSTPVRVVSANGFAAEVSDLLRMAVVDVAVLVAAMRAKDGQVRYSGNALTLIGERVGAQKQAAHLLYAHSAPLIVVPHDPLSICELLQLYQGLVLEQDDLDDDPSMRYRVLYVLL